MKDERIISYRNTVAAKVGVFLAYYITLSVVVKGFIIDTPFFLYWDAAFAMALVGLYVIYRSAGKGVPVEPASDKLIDKTIFTAFGSTSILFGIFTVFFVVPRHDTWPEYFPGIMEKIIGVLVIAAAFFVITIIVIWLMDYIPTKLAYKKSKELAGEEDDEESDMGHFIGIARTVKDERIESTLYTYTAHGFYALFVYILVSTFVKSLTLDIPMWHYFDAFIAAILAGGYFVIKMLKDVVFVTEST